MTDIEVSIVIPALNEERRLGKTLEDIKSFFNGRNTKHEIIVVDDGSTDKTADVFEKHCGQKPRCVLLRFNKNHGKGFAVKNGVLKSGGRLILTADADGSTPIEEFSRLRDKIEKGADIAIGSRYMKNSGAQRKQSFFRFFMGKLGNWLIRLLLLPNIKDTQCGFKLFKAAAAKKIFGSQTIKGFGFDMEVLALAQKFGYKIKEAPVSWFQSKESRVRPLRDGLRTFADLLKVRIKIKN